MEAWLTKIGASKFDGNKRWTEAFVTSNEEGGGDGLIG